MSYGAEEFVGLMQGWTEDAPSKIDPMPSTMAKSISGPAKTASYQRDSDIDRLGLKVLRQGGFS